MRVSSVMRAFIDVVLGYACKPWMRYEVLDAAPFMTTLSLYTLTLSLYTIYTRKRHKDG